MECMHGGSCLVLVQASELVLQPAGKSKHRCRTCLRLLNLKQLVHCNYVNGVDSFQV